MTNWSGVAQAYRESFASLCAGTEPRILDDLAPGPLLDVGSGTGSLASSALRRGFDVTAVDSDPDMVAMTNEAVPGRCTLGALPSLDLPDGSFPAVVANFVVNHLPDPRSGVRELARVTAPGGRMAVTTWPAGGAGWAPLVNEAFERAGAMPSPVTGLPPHLDFPRTTEGLAGLARQAGLNILAATTVEWCWQVPPEALWTGISGGVATIGARYRAQTRGVQRRIARAFRELASHELIGGELRFTCRAAYVLAGR